MNKVWDSLRTIPYGETRSYAEMAGSIGIPGALQGSRDGEQPDPISIFIPCHRVIGSNGRLVGYLGGLDLKERLLELEKTIRQTAMD